MLAAALSGDGKTLYIGGQFTTVGATTGSFAPLDANTGAVLPHPTINGAVNAQISDGTGGWYVAGSFTTVGGVAWANLAHIRVDGTLDTNFRAAVNLKVSSLALSGSNLYLSGCYSGETNGGQCVVESVDPATGSSAKWTTNVGDAALKLAVSGNSLYLGGGFLSVAGTNRFKLAALDTQTGALLPWNPNPGYGAGVPMIEKIVASGGTVYVGGQFTTIGGATRSAVAALDATSGQAQGWDAGLNAGADVAAIALDGSTVYIGGSFTTAGGQPHAGVAALDAGTAVALPWNAGLTLPYTPATVTALAVSASRIYIGGQFVLPGSSAIVRTAAIDKASAAPVAWLNVQAQNASITQLDVVGAQVQVGGSFALLSGASRNHIAAFDLTTGQVNNWNPNSVNTDGNANTGVVSQLLVVGSTVYVSGNITHIGSADRQGLAALDAATGVALPWNPQVNGAVTTLTASSTTLYVGGQTLRSVDGQSRAGLAAFDLGSGQLTGWAPDATGALAITRLVASDSAVYVGGAFSSMNGQARNGLAAFDAVSGALLPWKADAQTLIPNSGYNVRDMTLAAGTLYVVGDFISLGGQSRSGFGALDASTGAVRSLGPTVGLSDPRALAVNGDRVYMSNGDSEAVVTLSISKNAIVQTNYLMAGSVYGILAAQGNLYFFGNFTDSTIGVDPNLAVYGQ
ncbi:hypothetical protein ACFJGW_00915 [Burkholderiaceae bacterium UC74_6]